MFLGSGPERDHLYLTYANIKANMPKKAPSYHTWSSTRAGHTVQPIAALMLSALPHLEYNNIIIIYIHTRLNIFIAIDPVRQHVEPTVCSCPISGVIHSLPA